MQNYIYGASVQGIQQFIFQTNKLKEIIGASQLVDNICTSEFAKFCLDSIGHTIIEDNIIMSAAGNIRYLVDEATCQKIILSFPKHISNYAPGITISQSVVKQSENIKEDIDELEKRLNAQRNQPAMPMDIGFMGLGRARRTGGVAVQRGEGFTFIDRATQIKVAKWNEQKVELFQKFSGDNKARVGDIPFDMVDITKQKDNGWLAIVHADGNGIGLLLQNLKLAKGENTKVFYSALSKAIDKATCAATQFAYENVVLPKWEKEKERQENKNLRKPLRPVILGGDDLTLIIRADLAFDFTKSYLKEFERNTQIEFTLLQKNFRIIDFQNKLTACAGIAYIKESYPFHYGVQLAESLTSETKTKLKNLNEGHAPSAVNFYKVQASFIDDLKSMKERTHFTRLFENNKTKEKTKISFDYGPYLISEELEGVKGGAHIKDLEESLEFLLDKENQNSNPVAKLRQWSAELHKDKVKADFMLKRIKQVNGKMFEDLRLENILEKISDKEFTHKSKVNDLIVLSSF